MEAEPNFQIICYNKSTSFEVLFLPYQLHPIFSGVFYLSPESVRKVRKNLEKEKKKALDFLRIYSGRGDISRHKSP